MAAHLVFSQKIAVWTTGAPPVMTYFSIHIENCRPFSLSR